MVLKNKKLELLSPAGDFECLNSAIAAGTHAVYFGLQDFNMRGRAKNFKVSDLERIKKICELSPQIKDHKVWKDILEQTNTPDATRIEKAVHLLCKAWILTAMHL